MTTSTQATCQQVCLGASALAGVAALWLVWGSVPALGALMAAGGFAAILSLSLTRIACVDKGMARALRVALGLEAEQGYEGAVAAAPETAAPETAAPETAAPETGAVETTVGDATPPVRPALLDAPQGTPDDLTQIKGVGPKLATLCHEMGIYHFSQIAGWRAAEVAWMDAHLTGFRGRVTRDGWVAQAKALAAGKTPRKNHDNTAKEAPETGAQNINQGGL